MRTRDRTHSTSALIDLAPGHKIGLVADSPVWLAGGIIGLGETVPIGVDPHTLGGVVVGPLQRHPRAGAAPPRLAEAPGQLLLETGLQTRGLNATLKRYARYWSRLGAPVIVQLADTDLPFLAHVAARLAEHEAVSGFELLVPRRLQARTNRQTRDQNGELSIDWLTQALRIVDERSDLPIWVKLPIEEVTPLAPVAVEAGAAGIVIGRPPLGTLVRSQAVGQSGTNAAATPALLNGELFGPSIFPLMMRALVDLVQLALPTAIIACGGIHTVAQAEQVLAVGATALQLDSAVWIEPGIAGLIRNAL